MRLDIHADCYVAAAELLDRCGASIGDAAAALSDGLARCGGMAGHAGAAMAWAAAYDAVAARAVRGLEALGGDLADASATTRQCLTIHRVAEELATLGAPLPETGGLGPRHAVKTAPNPPVSEGENGGEPPGWGWFQSQLAGRVWPDADTGRVRTAAAAWRAVSTTLAALASLPAEAARELGMLAAPEVAPALDACGRLSRSVDDLAAAGTALAVRCEAFADAVDARRHQLLDLVAGFLAALAVGEAASAVFGVITAGLGELAGQAGVAVLVATYADRILACLSALDAEVAAVVPDTDGLALLDQTPVEGAAMTARPLGIGARAEPTPVEPPAVPEEADVSTSPEPPRPDTSCVSESTAFAEAGAVPGPDALYRQGDLDVWETAGGHTLARHVGWSDLELRSRLSRYPRLSNASSFSSPEHAERAVGDAFRVSASGILGWLTSGEGKLEIDCEAPYQVGRVLSRRGAGAASSRYRVVLVKDAAQRRGYRVLTAFPRRP